MLLVGAGALGVIAVAAYALTSAKWNHPCPGQQSLSCQGQHQFQTCWCDGDFNNGNHWTLDGPPNGNVADITHSHASVTDEDWLEMNFYNPSSGVYDLTVATDDTGGDDHLDIRFVNKNASGDTLVVTHEVILDATDDKLTLTAQERASGESVAIDTCGASCSW